MGKSTVNIESDIIQNISKQIRNSIDEIVIDDIWSPVKYLILKSWTDRRGRRMHSILANVEVREWLATEHSQYSVKNPDWWKFENSINITDKLYTLLVLRFAE